MSRLNPVSPEVASGKTKELYNLIKARLGVVPKMMQTMGHSPAFLEGYLKLGDALGLGTLGARTGELIALTVAQSNECDYCLSAHTYLATNLVKIDDRSIEAARSGDSTDQKTDAILKFAKLLVKKKGRLNDGEIAAVRHAGITDGQIGEIIGHVALNVLTNYLNIVADTEIDFPVVKAATLVV